LILNLLNPIITSGLSSVISDEDAVIQYLETQNVNYFNLLYDRYSDKVYAKCVSLLKDYTLAEDSTQEIFVKILLNCSKFNNKSKFSTWIYSITYNFCIDEIRRQKKEIKENVENFSSLDQIDNDIDDAQILEINVYRLKEVLEFMPCEDTSVLMMKYQDDMSIKDMSLVLNKTESAVKMKILRAKKKFINIYKEKYKHAM